MSKSPSPLRTILIIFASSVAVTLLFKCGIGTQPDNSSPMNVLPPMVNQAVGPMMGQMDIPVPNVDPSLTQKAGGVVNKSIDVADRAIDSAGVAVDAGDKVVDFGASLVDQVLTPGPHPASLPQPATSQPTTSTTTSPTTKPKL